MKVAILFSVLFFAQNILAASAAGNCLYSFDVDNSVVEGTGFKTTQKVGVAGKFLKFSTNSKGKKKSVKELLEGLVVTVDLMSVDSGNAIHDKNLREAFFSLLSENSKAQVTVKSVSEKELVTELSVHGKKKDVRFAYEIKKDVVEAKGSFDALDFAMTEAMDALKKRCGALHTGSDGKSKTWSTFDLRVEARLLKACK